MRLPAVPGCRGLESLLGEILKNYRLTAMVCMTVALTSCTDTEARVNASLKHEAEELVTAVSGATDRNGFRDHDSLEETLRLLPDRRIVARSLRNLWWEGDTLRAVVSFSNAAQATEGDGAGRYSARAGGELIVAASGGRPRPARQKFHSDMEALRSLTTSCLKSGKGWNAGTARTSN